MRSVLCLALLVPVLAMAAGNMMTVAAPTPGTARSAVPVRALVGTMDTVGGTVYDAAVNGPTYRFVVNSPDYGIHVVWMWSNDTLGGQADCNMRYNFYNYPTRTWNWIDPAYMLSGFNTFGERASFGSLGVNLSTGAAVISCQAGSAPIRPVVARDMVAGAGVFEFCDGSPTLDNHLWPPIDVDTAGGIHMACFDSPGRRNLWYSKCDPWCTWSPPVQSAPVAPTFPTQQVACSKRSDKVCLTWVEVVDDVYPHPGYYRLSNDRGSTWDPPVNLGYPPAYSNSPDTGASYYVTSLNPFYDLQDRLHIVVDVMPIIHYGGGADTAFRWPNEIWHWCADNTPQWSKVARADGDVHATYDPGTNALLACRPQLGTDSRGNLFATWEQFDTTNFDPLTTLLRADIWLSGSNSNGVSWTPAIRIAEAGTSSLRFPSITDMAISGAGGHDTLGILYQADQVAGFRAGSSPIGPWSSNPMIFQKVPTDSVGIIELRQGAPDGFDLAASPNPLGGRTIISYALPRAGDVSLVVYDAVGRPVQTLVSGRREAGRFNATWDAGSVPAGVYFYTLTCGRTSVTRKLILAH